MANLVGPGEPVAVAACGKFGERWLELCQAYGGEVEYLEVEWGEAIAPEDLDRAIAGMKRPPGAVFTTHSESSTGVVNDVRALAAVAHDHGAVICVDAISGLGAVELPQDEWGVDVVVAGLAEGADVPAGARLRLGERAGDVARRRASRPALLLRLAADRLRAGGGAAEQPLHPGGDALARPRRRPRADRGGGAGRGSTSATRSSPAPPAPGSRRSASSGSGPTTTAPTCSPRRACRIRSTALRCRS